MSTSQDEPGDGNDGYLFELTSQAPSFAASFGESNDGLGVSHREPQFEGGEVENEPEVRLDVVRESDQHAEEELPEQGLARSLLTHFKDIETEAQQTKQKEHRPSGVAVKATPTPLRPAIRTEDSDSNDTYRPPAQERSEVENDPIVRTDVVKESDSNVAEELPERGMARNLLSKFKSMEVEAQQRADYKPSGASARVVSDVHLASAGVQTWKGSPTRSTSGESHREPVFEGGDVENTPQVRTDVVRESDNHIGEELPEPGIAQSLLSRFKTLESEATKKSEYKPSGVAHKATPSKMHIMAGRSTYIPDGTTKGGNVESADTGNAGTAFEPKFEGGEFENTPEVRSDVIRESDRVLDEDLPQQGLAKNLLSRFKSIEAEASVKKDYVPSGVGSKPTPTPLGLAATAVGVRRPASLHDGSSDSRGASSERDHTPSYSGEVEESTVNGGEYESVPAPRADGVVGASDNDNRDELPESGLAQSMLSKFKSLESQRIADYQPSGVGSKAADDPAALAGAAPSEHHVDAGLSRTPQRLSPLPEATSNESSSSSSCGADRLDETTEADLAAACAAAATRCCSFGSHSTCRQPDLAIRPMEAPNALARSALGGHCAESSGQPAHACVGLVSPTYWAGSMRAIADGACNERCSAADPSLEASSSLLTYGTIDAAASFPSEDSNLHAFSHQQPESAASFLSAPVDEHTLAKAEILALSSVASALQSRDGHACHSQTIVLPTDFFESHGNATVSPCIASCSSVAIPLTTGGGSPPAETIRPPEAANVPLSSEGEKEVEIRSRLHPEKNISHGGVTAAVATDLSCIQTVSYSSEFLQHSSIFNDGKMESTATGTLRPENYSMAAVEFRRDSENPRGTLSVDIPCSPGDGDITKAQAEEQLCGSAFVEKSERPCRCGEHDSDAVLSPGVILDVLTYGSAAPNLCSLCAAGQENCNIMFDSIQAASPAPSNLAALDLPEQLFGDSSTSDVSLCRINTPISRDALPSLTEADHSEFVTQRLMEVQFCDNSDTIAKAVVSTDHTQHAIQDLHAAKVDSESNDNRSLCTRSPLHATLPLSLMLPTIRNGVILRPAVNSSQETEPFVRVGSAYVDEEECAGDAASGATNDGSFDSSLTNEESSIVKCPMEAVCMMESTESGRLPGQSSAEAKQQLSRQFSISSSVPAPVDSSRESSTGSDSVPDSLLVLSDLESAAGSRISTSMIDITGCAKAAGNELFAAHCTVQSNETKSPCEAVDRLCENAAHQERLRDSGDNDDMQELVFSTAAAAVAAEDATSWQMISLSDRQSPISDRPIACTAVTTKQHNERASFPGEFPVPLFSTVPRDDSNLSAAPLPLLAESLLSTSSANAVSSMTSQSDSSVELEYNVGERRDRSSCEACPGFAPTAATEKQPQNASKQCDESDFTCVELTRASTDKQLFDQNSTYSSSERVATPDRQLPQLTKANDLDEPSSMVRHPGKAVEVHSAPSEVSTPLNSPEFIDSSSSLHRQNVNDIVASSTKVGCTPDEQPLCLINDTRLTSSDANVPTAVFELPFCFTCTASNTTTDSSPSSQVLCAEAIDKRDVTLASQTALSPRLYSMVDTTVAVPSEGMGNIQQAGSDCPCYHLSAAIQAPAGRPRTNSTPDCATINSCDDAARRSVSDAQLQPLSSTDAVLSSPSAQPISQRIDSPNALAEPFHTALSKPSPALCQEGIERLPAVQVASVGNVMQQLCQGVKSTVSFMLDSDGMQSTEVTDVKKSDLSSPITRSSPDSAVILPSRAADCSGSAFTELPAESMKTPLVQLGERATPVSSDASRTVCIPALDAVAGYRCSETPSRPDGSDTDSSVVLPSKDHSN